MITLNKEEANDIVSGESNAYTLVDWGDARRGRWSEFQSGICKAVTTGKFYRMPEWAVGLTELQECDPYFSTVNLVEVERVETKKVIEVVSVKWIEVSA